MWILFLSKQTKNNSGHKLKRQKFIHILCIYTKVCCNFVNLRSHYRNVLQLRPIDKPEIVSSLLILKKNNLNPYFSISVKYKILVFFLSILTFKLFLKIRVLN